MPETFFYDFTGPNGELDDIYVTVGTPASDTTGYGASDAVQDISGTIGSTAITGEVGTGGTAPQYSEYSTFDNAIFTSSGTGVDGNIAGIDYYGLDFNAGGVEYNLYTQNGTFILAKADASLFENMTLTATDAPCFTAGTRIATPLGDVPVEALRADDMLITAAGEARPVRWIGRSTVSTRFADPLRVLPIRIRAGALGENLPVRDLLVSPDHAMFIDGVLLQAGALVNGSSIIRETDVPESFVYYHVELGSHELILAEGAPTESFVDNLDRMNFENWAEHQALFGATAPIAELAYPRAKAARQVPQAIRKFLAERAARFSLPLAA